LLASGKGLVSEARGGLGYSMFAIVMTVGRLSGDFVTARVGDRAVLFWGGLATMAGFALVLSAPIASLAMRQGFQLRSGYWRRLSVRSSLVRELSRASRTGRELADAHCACGAVDPRPRWAEEF